MIKIFLEKYDQGYWARNKPPLTPNTTLDHGKTAAEAVGALYEKLAELPAQEILGRLILGNLESFGVEIDDSGLAEAIVGGVVINSVGGVE